MTRYGLPFLAVMLSAASAAAMPLALPQAANPLLIKVGAADCKGPIATEKRPIRGAARLARMRREGKLPDSFVCGHCRYDLAGDPSAAYYVKTCK